MSTVRTRLQARSGAAHATLASVRPSSPLSDKGSDRRTYHASDAARRSYSDVAASRSPSPVVHSEEEIPRASTQNVGEGERPSESNRISKLAPHDVNNEGNATLPESSDSEHDDNPNKWTTVQRKRSSKKHGTSKERSRRRDVSNTVDSAIAEAEKALTAAQKKIIERRQKKVNINPPEESGPSDEGPSGVKGKGIDPRNWGNVQLSEEEADVEAQQAALDSFSTQKKQYEYDLPPHQSLERERQADSAAPGYRASKTPSVRAPKNTRPPESRPEAQIAPKSFLGVTLQKLGKKSRREKHDSPSDSSSSESSSDSSSSESESSDSTSSGSNERSRKKYRKKRSKKHRRRRRSSSRKSRSALKVFKPKHYNGDADARAYHRFVKESMAYIEDNKIKSKRRAFALSYFLDGKAYDFSPLAAVSDPVRPLYMT